MKLLEYPWRKKENCRHEFTRWSCFQPCGANQVDWGPKGIQVCPYCGEVVLMYEGEKNWGVVVGKTVTRDKTI